MAEPKPKPKLQNFFDLVHQTKFFRKIKLVNRFFDLVFQFSGSIFQFRFFLLTPSVDHELFVVSTDQVVYAVFVKAF